MPQHDYQYGCDFCPPYSVNQERNIDRNAVSHTIEGIFAEDPEFLKKHGLIAVTSEHEKHNLIGMWHKHLPLV